MSAVTAKTQKEKEMKENIPFSIDITMSELFDESCSTPEQLTASGQRLIDMKA